AIAAAVAVAGAEERLAVLALGRLGTREFDLGSDADLLFIRDPQGDAPADGRAAERVVQALAAYTREGTVFPVDPRLRPHGQQGELVLTPAQLAAYFAGEAQPWEAISYTKLRLVAGAGRLGEQALQAVAQALPRFATRGDLAEQLREMRQRLE